MSPTGIAFASCCIMERGQDNQQQTSTSQMRVAIVDLCRSAYDVLYTTSPRLWHLADAMTTAARSLQCIVGVQGEQQALARFQSADAAKAFLDSKPDGKLTVGDAEASLALLEGEEETAYIAKVRAGATLRLVTMAPRCRNALCCKP